MPQVELALSIAESTANVQNLGQSWGMRSQRCTTVPPAQARARMQALPLAHALVPSQHQSVGTLLHVLL